MPKTRHRGVRWSRSDMLTGVGLLLALAGVFAAVIVIPEVRRFIGLDVLPTSSSSTDGEASHSPASTTTRPTSAHAGSRGQLELAQESPFKERSEGLEGSKSQEMISAGSVDPSGPGSGEARSARLGDRSTQVQTHDDAERSKYINVDCGNGDARAVMVVLDGSPNLALSSSVAQRLQGRDDCFTPAFVHDALFAQALAGDMTALRHLRVHEWTREVLLVDVRSEGRTTNPADQEMTRVDVRLNARVVQAGQVYRSAGTSVQSWGL
jgi:hypothetical protein